MRTLRALIYKVGLRPKRGSIFHSPSRHMQLAMKDFGKRMQEGLNRNLPK